MIRAFTLAAALVSGAGLAHAQDGRAAEASPEMLHAALQAAVAQRDQALNDGLRVSAQLVLAQREIARLRQERDAARKAPPPATETK